VKSAALAGSLILVAAAHCTVLDVPPPPPPVLRLAVRAPDLTHPVTESYPTPSTPEDPVKRAVFEQINVDRAAQGLPAVAWDEAASRVADVFTAAQIREGTRGHFLLDGFPPYARTGFAGIFGMGAENSVAWRTVGAAFHEPSVDLALEGQASMLAEKPPDDGHRRTILDPLVTHVGIGWAQGGGDFRMAEEFLTRRLDVLTISQVASSPLTVLFRGRTVSGDQLRFVTLAVEPSPRPISKAQANGRRRYTYPEPRLAFVPEGMKTYQVVGATTEDVIHVGGSGEFSFRFTPAQPGLWTILFHVTDGRERPRPGGLAVLWIEKG
jgi:hypothetical protein